MDTTAAIYVRRSAADERDADDSDNRSHARQERDCQVLAERHGLTVVEVLTGERVVRKVRATYDHGADGHQV